MKRVRSGGSCSRGGRAAESLAELRMKLAEPAVKMDKSDRPKEYCDEAHALDPRQ